MNQFGRNLRISIFGASHGSVVGVTIDGCPAGLSVTAEDFLPDLARRRTGAAGTSLRHEPDIPQFLSGIYEGATTGAPITISFQNTNTQSADYKAFADTPRPGHADFVLRAKFAGYNDPRGGGHSSGRMTVALVAAAVLAKKIIHPITIKAALVEAGGDVDIEAAIARAVDAQDSIGGIVACTASGVPIGLGEPFFDSIESKISQIIFAIPATKAIEFGSGFAAARMTGSEHNDALVDGDGRTNTNHAGGINGGISNGNDIYFRVAVKPTSSTPKPQQTWNLASQQMETFQVKGRHDLCIALRAPVVVEAATALALADLYLDPLFRKA